MEFLKRNKNIILGILFLALVGSNYFFFQQLQDEKIERQHQEKVSASNIEALLDQVQQVKDKQGEIESNASSFVNVDIEQMRRMNQALYDRMRAIEGNISYLANAKTSVSIPEGLVEGIVRQIEYANYKGGKVEQPSDKNFFEYKWDYNYSDKGVKGKITGLSQVAITDNSITDHNTRASAQFDLDLVMGVKEKDDRYLIFAKSESPNFKVNSLSGVTYIEKSKNQKVKRFGFGPYFGVGWDGEKIRPNAGVGITYDILQLKIK